MKNLSDEQEYRVLAFQTIEVQTGILLRRGGEQFLINGGHSLDFVRLLSTFQALERFKASDLLSHFAQPDHPAILQIVGLLASKRFIVPLDPNTGIRKETSEDIFHWNFGIDRQKIDQSLRSLQVSIVGIGHLAQKVAVSLTELGIKPHWLIDDPLLRNLDFFDDNGKFIASDWPLEGIKIIEPNDWQKENHAQHPRCVIAVSDFGGRQLLQPWNEFCCEQKIPFLPVFIQEMKGYAGPLVIPGETACFHCMTLRQNSNFPDLPLELAIENVAFEGQNVFAAHPLMFSLLAGTAVLKLVRFFGGLPSPWPDTVSEIDFLNETTSLRKILKVPRCHVCSNLNQYPSPDPFIIRPLADS